MERGGDVRAPGFPQVRILGEKWADRLIRERGVQSALDVLPVVRVRQAGVADDEVELEERRQRVSQRVLRQRAPACVLACRRVPDAREPLGETV